MKLDQKKYYKIIALLLIKRLWISSNEEFEIRNWNPSDSAACSNIMGNFVNSC